MPERRIISAGELNARINYNNPYSYQASVRLASYTDIQEEEILTDSHDFWVADILVDVRDAAGKSVLEEAIANQFTVNIQSEDGEDFVYKDGVTLRQMASLVNSIRFKGWCWESKTRYTVKISGEAFPASELGTAPYDIVLTFMGYRMIKSQG